MQTVGDIMSRPVTTVGMDDSLNTIQRIFDETVFHHLVVVQDRKPIGVISDRDLLRHLSPFIGNDLLERPQDINTLRKRAHQVMHRDLVTVHIDAALHTAAALLLDRMVGCLPVVGDQGLLRGILTWRDLLPHCRWEGDMGGTNAA
jgi:acetoin utilization protein AcuB